MNIFHKVALEGLKKNKTRTVVTIFGVILSAAMITAVATFGVSLLQYMIKGAVQKYGAWQVAFLDADTSFVKERELDREVAEAVTFENIGYAALEADLNPGKPYVFIAGFQQEAFEKLPLNLISGRLPENDGEILVTGKASTDGGASYGVGDTITLAVGSRRNGNVTLGQDHAFTEEESLVPHSTRTYKVVGIMQTPVFERDSAPGYTLITRSEKADPQNTLSLFLTLLKPDQIHTYAENVAAGHSYILNNDVLRFMGLSDDASDRIFNTLLFSVGGIVIAIIMTGSIFLIYNAFSISLNERTRQIGILSSVGATARQLRGSVLFEGLCIGAVGIPMGILTGLGSIWLVILVVARNFVSLLYAGIPLTMYVSVPVLFAAAGVSLVTVLISAYLPAKRAVRVPIMECIRQTNEVKLESGTVKTSRLSQRIYGLEGTLALKNFKRNKRRYRSIVLSLVLSIVLFNATSAFVTNLEQTARQFKVVTTYDIGFGTQAMEDSAMLELYGQLKTAAGVTDSSYQSCMEFTATVPADKLSGDYWEATGGHTEENTVQLPLDVQFLDDRAYLNIIESLGLPPEEYTGSNSRVIAVGKIEQSDAEGVSELPDLFTVPSMDITVSPKGTGPEAARELKITIVETVPPDIPPVSGSYQKKLYDFQVMAPWSLKETLASTAPDTALRVKGLGFRSENPSQTLEEMTQIIQGMAVSCAYILLNTSRMLEESRNYIFIANVFAYTFIIMISLIAVANVFNTISTNIRQRRQELAMLRSMGMSEGKFNKMMCFECVFYGMRALLVGLPLAVFLCWLIYKAMFLGGADQIDFKLPWASMGISVFVVLLIIFVTMMYSVSKIKKENIIDALRDDMA